MKKFLFTLLVGLTLSSLSWSATLTFSNFTADGTALHGIADSDDVLIGEGQGFGVLGRMTVTDGEIATMLEENNIAGLVAAFEVFDPTASGTFTLNSLDQNGAFETSITYDTRASQNAFGGSPIYVWLYKGATRLTATNMLLAKLNANFPTDSETNPPQGPIRVYLRPDTATFATGSVGSSTHDFGFGGGAVTVLQMAVQVNIPVNQAPTANDGVLAIVAGTSEDGVLVAIDPDEDELTFSKVSDPTKGTVTVNPDGTYTYSANVGTTGTDSFTFKANDGEFDSNVATITVTISGPPPPEAPVIAVSELPIGFVGTYYEFQIEIDNLPQGEASTYAAKGLPPGLKLNTKTGLISGYPTKDYPTGKEVTLTAKNSEGTSEPVLVNIVINAVPEAVVGTFLARVERAADIAGGLGGCLNLTTTSKGSFSAKLVSGADTYTGKGKLEITEGDESPVVAVNIIFARKNKPTLVADLLLDIGEPSVANFQLTGSLTDEEADATTDVSGVRNVWSKLSKPEDYLGNYTFGLSIPEDLVSDESIPQGYGFGALTITDKGVGSFIGKAADGQKFTFSSIVGPQGHLPFFCAFKNNAGSLVSIPQVVVPETPSEVDLNSLTGVMSWSKPEADVKSKERAYRDGFEAFDLTIFGGLYVGPESGGVIGGLPDLDADTSANALLSFSDGGLEEGDIDSFAFTIMNKKDTGTKQTVIVPKYSTKLDPNPNPNNISFKLLTKPAGQFNGKFTLPNEVKSLTRTVAFDGMMVRQSDGSFFNCGFFLLPEPEDPKKSALWSGMVILDPIIPPVD